MYASGFRLLQFSKIYLTEFTEDSSQLCFFFDKDFFTTIFNTEYSVYTLYTWVFFYQFNFIFKDSLVTNNHDVGCNTRLTRQDELLNQFAETTNVVSCLQMHAISLVAQISNIFCRSRFLMHFVQLQDCFFSRNTLTAACNNFNLLNVSKKSKKTIFKTTFKNSEFKLKDSIGFTSGCQSL